MTKSADDHTIDPDKLRAKDHSVVDDAKKVLVKEVQAGTATTVNNGSSSAASDNFGHSFNKVVATVTGAQIESVADSLSQKTIDKLHRGKILDEQMQNKADLPLSKDDRAALEQYKGFKDKISRQIPVFDHDALMDTLDARIAERYSQAKSSSSSASASSRVQESQSAKSQPVESERATTSAIPATSAGIAKNATSAKDVTTEKVPLESIKNKTELQLQVPSPFQSQKSLNSFRDPFEKIVRSLIPSKNAPDTQYDSKDATQAPVRSAEKAPLPANNTSRANTAFEDQARVSNARTSQKENYQYSEEKSSGRNIFQMPNSQALEVKVEVSPQRQASDKFYSLEKSGVPSIFSDMKNLHVSKSVLQALIVSNSLVPTALSEKSVKTLRERENPIQRNFAPAFQNHTGTSKELERIVYQTGLALSRPGKTDALVPKDNISLVDSNTIRASLSRAGATGPQQHDQMSDKAVPAKESLHLSDRKLFDSSGAERRIQAHVELVSSFSVQIENHKLVNLPVTNFLARLPSSSITRKVDASTATFVQANPGFRNLTNSQRTQLTDRSVGRSPLTDETSKKQIQEQPGEFVATRLQSGQRRYILGSEFAFVAMLAVGGIAKTRQEKVIPQDIASQSVPRPNPELVNPSSAEKLENRSEKTDLTGFLLPISDLILRRIDDDIESFSIPSVILQKVKTATAQTRQSSQKILAHSVVNETADGAVQQQPLFRPIILIELHDTLQAIAEKYFNDVRIGWLIADLNSGNVRESYVGLTRIVSLQSRQPITLPVWSDIETFYKTQLTDLKIENLVTVVETSQIDIELYSDTFANVIDNNSK